MGRLTLALATFGLVLFAVAMAAVQIPIYIANLPNSSAGLGWMMYLLVLPSLITGVISGLTAALGAYIASRLYASQSLGAGFGGSVGSTLFLLYLSWLYQDGPGLWILVLGYILAFGAYIGFTALWMRRTPRVRAN